MGAWGWKLFQSDEASDIRDTYQEKLIVGESDEAAENSVIEEFELNQNPKLWVPLAVTEWNAGRLGSRARENALRGIEVELSELEDCWKPEYIDRRRAELLRVREQLQADMPPRKKLRFPSWAWKCPWPVGSVLQYKLRYLEADDPLANQYVLLLIQGISETPPGKIPCETIAVSLYQWSSHLAPADLKCEWEKAPELTDFITESGYRYATRSISVFRDLIRENEIKCIRKSPLSPGDLRPASATGPGNAVFEELISETLNRQPEST